MKKITNSEMIGFLSATKKKYLYLINDIKKQRGDLKFDERK